jgi:hypothetical protein
MTVEDVRQFVEAIGIGSDDEASHSTEDLMYRAVLRAIANGAENPAELAAEALKASHIQYERWCA